MEILSTLFGSSAKVKTIRLFLFNQERAFAMDDISKRTGEKKSVVKKILTELLKISLIRKKSFLKEFTAIKKRKKITKKKKTLGFIANQDFKYIQSLQGLLI